MKGPSSVPSPSVGGGGSRKRKSKRLQEAAAAAGVESVDLAGQENNGTVPPEESILNVENVEILELELEPEPAKKPKPDEYEEIKKEFLKCDEILANSNEDDSTPISHKLKCLIRLFQSILNNNVNTMVVKDDFPAWVKTSIQTILVEVKVVSEKFITFLKLSLKVAPTIFEPILESILAACIFLEKDSPSVQPLFEEFISELIITFEKLRRFPKFIAKLLCCLRDNFCKNQGTGDIKPVNLPSSFFDTIDPVITLLPSGQIFDLWKTLQHNLDTECLTQICSSNDPQEWKRRTYFLSIVVDFIVEFLSNIKVTDSAIPVATVEKIADMMKVLKDDSLKRLGMEIVENKFEVELTKSFLKLAYAWAELNQMMQFYNSKYSIGPLEESTLTGKESEVATNLYCLHPYLTPSDWTKLGNLIMKSKEPSLKSLLVRLVSQKLIYSVNVENDNSTSEGSTKKHLQKAADFIWDNHSATDLSEEALILVTQYIEPSKVIELASNVVQGPKSSSNIFELGKNSGLDSSENPVFHYSLILESLKEILKRISKMKLLSKPITNLLEESLSLDNRTHLIVQFSQASQNKPENAKESVVAALLAEVNNVIESSDTKKTRSSLKKSKDEFSSEMINDLLKGLLSLDLEMYSKEVKTIVFLCSLVILVALVEQSNDNDIFDLIAKIIANSGSKSHGNTVLFSIHWVKLFKWFATNIQRFSSSVQQDVFHMILSNIYVSPKLVSEFEEIELNRLINEDQIDLNSGMGHLAMIALEFYTKELEGDRDNSKGKLTTQIQSHSKMSSEFAVNKLESSDVKDIDSDRDQFASNTFRAFWLCTLAANTMEETTLSNFKRSIENSFSPTLKLVKEFSTVEENDTFMPCKYALQFLHALSKSKDSSMRPKHFFSKVWKGIFRAGLWKRSIIPKQFVKDLMEKSSLDEFKKMGDSILAKINSTLTDDQTDQEDYKMTMFVLNELTDSELDTEKHNLRRHVVQEFLHVSLSFTLDWKSDADSVKNVVLPYIQLQTKLLRRRNALVNLRSLAVCFASATSAPLFQVQDIPTFRILFCAVGDLLNAFAVHRLDVISFRAHVFLQCFQHLAESLAAKADQKNKLNDEDIGHLRHCGHSVERICQSMKLGQKELSRVSPYFIAVLMKRFETVTMYPAIKAPLLSGCYRLLDLCDDQGVAHLNALLTVGSREMFKTLYDQYKKYYEYKGRV